jgi:hypothetical protein
VSFHLRKLEEAGLVVGRKEQYYVVFAADEALLGTTLREIVAGHDSGQELQADRLDHYRRKVLATFLHDGRLETLPAQHKKRLIVLEHLATRFVPGRRYSEAEVTALITPVHADYCTIRRLLVDAKFIQRDGTTYWHDAPAGDALAEVLTPLPAKKPRDRTSSPRALLKRTYKQNRPAMGIYQIRNTVNGRIYVGQAANLEGTRNSRLFQLKMGKIVFSRELQKDRDLHGADAFAFSVLEEIPPTAPAEQERTLLARYVHWLEQLQPFGEQGYNSRKAFEREAARLR